METMAQFAVFAAVTAVGAGLAFAMTWVFLRGTFRLMQPAAVRRVARPVSADLVHGTRAMARQFVRN